MVDDVNVQRGPISDFQSNNKPFGKGSRHCRSCFTYRGLIRKYELNMCRRCFREYADKIGFKKLD
ncbi:40S ribosomal S29 [Tubulinosema ratisbonensis]|uniref:40S ribosomal S29 n=1 Tax=Tubulinosema ratisbonensis TaxID=291195 RepID=A0A437APV2_9MICR|nr:40S ribosomal S29 [Tubulinosema ratisbonensis]